MKRLNLEDLRYRPDVIRLKRRFGMAYGMVVGLSFAVSTWGIDSYLLSRGHAMYPWIKILIGALICAMVGAIAGWLVAKFEKGILAPILYLGASFVFSWLIFALPLQIFPKIVLWLDPETGGMLNYMLYENFGSRFFIAFGWVALFVTLAGVLQMPLVEPSAFSTSFFGKIAPLVVCSVIMFINGSIVDTLNNEPLRTAVLEMDNTIQFTLEHRGEEVDRALARAMHLTSLRAVQDVVDQPRQLIVGSYDEWLGQINVLIRFGNTWVVCTTVYSQPSFCKYVNPP